MKNSTIKSKTEIWKGKEMYYLMMHSKHSILWLYGDRYMVRDYSDNQKGNPLPPYHWLFFLINSKGSLISTIPQDSMYHSLCFTTYGVLVEMGNW